jgi:uracil-DNA glycosylase
MGDQPGPDSEQLTACLSNKCVFGRVCVPSYGPAPADLMFIAEAPGFREVEEGRPLVGPAGKLFNNLLAQAGTHRSHVFTANTAGCVDQEREDKRPLPSEIEACRPRLLYDIHVVQPKAIITMGNIANLLFFPNTTVSKVRGKVRNWNGTPVIATYHPAYALPHRNPDVQPLIVEDIKLAMTLIT